MSQAPDPSAENLSLLVILSVVGNILRALRIIFVFVDMEEKVSLSFSEVYISVFQFEGGDIIPFDSNDLSALSGDRITSNLYRNQGLFCLAGSLYALACDPQLKRSPKEINSQQAGPVRVTPPR